MNRFGKLVCITSIFALAGCATREDMMSLQRDVDEVKTRLLQVDREVTGVRSATREDLEKSLATHQQELEQLRRNSADIQATIESTKVDNQVLAGKLDDLTLLAQKPAGDISLLREDLDRRMKGVEERIGKIEKGVGELQKTLAEAEAKSKEVVQTPEALYQQALDTFRAGDASKARELFSRFLESNPTHDLVANAHYWLGETFYAEKKFDQAILEFQEIIKNFPKKEKVPAAMLKQAMAFREIGDVKSARYVLKKLQDDFPLSDEAQKAKERLKEMK